MDISKLTIKSVQQGYRDKSFSCEELVKEYQARIKKLDKDLSAFLLVTEKQAEADAKKVDQKIKKGARLKTLEGIPFAAKDNILVQGEVTTAGSKILSNYKASYNATVIDKLKKAGAIVLGKTNLDEFGMGASTERSSFQPTKNPWDKKKVPGGSSGGSAVAVAASFSTFALGSDTGGSIRQPAAFCGVVGLKPTYGRVSRYGLIALASSLDQIGPMTKNVEDAAYVLKEIAGQDQADSTTQKFRVDDFVKLLNKDIKGVKIGIIQEFFQEGLNPEIAQLVKQAAGKLEKLGANVSQVSLPNIKYALPAYYLIMPAEASANLARYDGIRYGQRQPADDLISQYKKNRAQGLGEEVRRRIMLGTYALSAGYYDQYYHKARQVRQVIKSEFQNILNDYDILIGPTTPTTAFDLGAKTDDPLSMYLSDIYTVAANITGIPAISLPVGLSQNLPVGVQLMSGSFQEAKLLNVAYQLEQELDLGLAPSL